MRCSPALRRDGALEGEAAQEEADHVTGAARHLRAHVIPWSGVLCLRVLRNIKGFPNWEFPIGNSQLGIPNWEFPVWEFPIWEFPIWELVG